MVPFNLSVILMDFIEKWKYKLTGRTVPVIRVVDVEQDGKIKSLTISKWVRKANTLLETWDNIGASIDSPDGILSYTDESGLTKPAYATYKGTTVPLYTIPIPYANHERTVGAAATVDDLATVLGIAPSMRDKIIFLLIGLMIGWLFVAPVVSGMAK
jgi:hypothetical protein